MAKNRDKNSAHLILGGARSGKTAYALYVAEKTGLEKCMIVTAKAEDQEMMDRIAWHRAERSPDWIVVEEGLQLSEALQGLARLDRVVVVDCLTLWLSNLFFEEKDWVVEAKNLADCLESLEGSTIFVSNEIGLGLVPESHLARAFRDAHGRLNQILAETCEAVTFVAAGLPVILKKDSN